MTQPPVFILEKERAAGQHLLHQLTQIDIPAQWMPTAADLLSESEAHAPAVCLVGLHPPEDRVLALVANLTQEPRFAQTAFILMGPLQHRHAAFEAGADDYMVAPPDAIELRKRVRLYLDRAMLEARLVAESSISQEMHALSDPGSRQQPAAGDGNPVTLLEHAAALHEERNLFERILLHAGSAIGLVTPEGALRYANPAWERLWGLEPGDDSLAFGWPPVASDSTTTQAMARAVQETREWQGEARFTLDGRPKIDIAMTITPAFDANGELNGFVVVQYDISERKAAEMRKSRFISDAAAEMRTPVTNIKMRQYLLREVPPEQRGDHLDALERESNRLTHMVEAILELSRIDAEQVQMHFEPVSLQQLAREVFTRYESAASDQGVTLDLSGGEDLAPIQIDHSRITRALGTLVKNALQHTSEGDRIAIQVGAASHAGEPYQTLTVRDTGTGIAEEDLPLVFNRFYRSDRTRMRGIRGVGLGLSIAQEHVRGHGGTLTVESTVDEGSTFVIWLPARAR